MLTLGKLILWSNCENSLTLYSFIRSFRGDGSADVVLDDDVQREKDIVDSYFNTQKMDYKGRLAAYATSDVSSCEFLVLVDDLIKIYNPLSSFVSASSRKVAVRNVSFAIRPGRIASYVISTLSS